MRQLFSRWWQIAIVAVSIVVPVAAVRAQGITLRELGFPDGFVLRGPRSSAEAFFPLPSRPIRPELVLDVQPSPMLDRYSSVSIFVGDTPIGAVSLKDGPRIERIAIPPALAQGEFLPVRFVGDQALRREEVCFDNDTPGVWTRIGAGTALQSNAEGPDGIGAVWRRLAGRVAIALPAPPALPDIEAALTVATALWQRGAEPVMVGPGDPAARIRIGRSSTPLALEEVATEQGQWRIRVSDTAAARALVAGAPLLRTLSSAVAAGAPNSVVAGANAGSVSFAELGLRLQQVSIFSSGTLTFELPFDRLPPGRRPAALQLFGRGPAVPPNEALAVSITAGGRLLWSNVYRGSMELAGVEVALPPDLLRHRMSVTIRFSRIGARRDCSVDDSLPFQLRETSRVLLSEGYATVQDFGGFAVNGERSALVRVDVPANEAVASVPLMARLLYGAAARPQAIEVGTGAALNRPFMLLSRTAPGEITGVGLLRPDLGRVVLEDQRNGARVEVSPAAGLSVVQLVSAGPVPGLWLSPGADASLATPTGLTLGNVAVFDGQTRPAVFDTRRPVTVVEDSSLAGEVSLLDRWRNELFLLAWVLVTVLAVLFVVRLRRRRG